MSNEKKDEQGFAVGVSGVGCAPIAGFAFGVSGFGVSGFGVAPEPAPEPPVGQPEPEGFVFGESAWEHAAWVAEATPAEKKEGPADE